MEMQASANQYAITEADSKVASYHQGFANSRTINSLHQEPKKMRVLFSGNGKAEADMGMAPIPTLCRFAMKLPSN